jgi:hypothetical protein
MTELWHTSGFARLHTANSTLTHNHWASWDATERNLIRHKRGEVACSPLPLSHPSHGATTRLHRSVVQETGVKYWRDRIETEGDATLLVLFRKHKLCAKNTIHKTVVLVLKKRVKQKVWGAVGWINRANAKWSKPKSVTFNSVLLVSAFVVVRRSLLPPFSG